MKIVFCGTPDFSVPPLKALLDCKEQQVLAVITQPDKPAGRSMKLQASPVKVLAESVHLPVHQPTLSREIKPIMDLYKPDVVIVVAYGKLLKADLIHTYTCINIHSSLLPKYRGASPIQAAILNGETETGVTIMLLDEKMDEGDILKQARVAIAADQTGGELHDVLAPLGAKLLLETLVDIQSKGIDTLRKPQIHAQARYCAKINNSVAEIDWKKTPTEIHNHIRGFSPWPGAFTIKDSIRVKVLRSALKDGQVKILEVQPAGKSVMGYEAYLRGGYPALTGY